MGASRLPAEAASPDQDELDRRLREETGGIPRWWSNGPDDQYGWHDHPYHKVLYCAKGSIVFHLREGDLELAAGDRLDIEPLTEHAATVGAEGVTCVEAAKSS
jgi:quercetin dioxygenase-like cupin family protein